MTFDRSLAPVSRRALVGGGLALSLSSATRVRAQQSATPIAVRGYRLAILVPFEDDAFWTMVTDSASRRCRQLGASLEVLTLTTFSVPDQLAQFDAALESGAEGVLLGAIDATGLVPGVQTAADAGVTVIAIDVEPPSDQLTSHIYSDMEAGAKTAGAFIGDLIGGQGKVLFIQVDPESDAGYKIDQGFTSGLAPFIEVTIDESYSLSWDDDGAESIATSRLLKVGSATPELVEDQLEAIFAANGALTVGAMRALADEELVPVPLIGYGLTPETRVGLETGKILAVVSERADRIGAIAVDAMLSSLNGHSVGRRIEVGHDLLTKETLPAATPVAADE